MRAAGGRRAFLPRLALLPALALLLGALGLFAAGPAQAQNTVTIWSTTLDVQNYDYTRGHFGHIVGRGCTEPRFVSTTYRCRGALTDDSFSYGGQTYRVAVLQHTNYLFSGTRRNQIDIALDRNIPAAIAQRATLVVGSTRWPLADGAVGGFSVYRNGVEDASLGENGYSWLGSLPASGRVRVSLEMTAPDVPSADPKGWGTVWSSTLTVDDDGEVRGCDNSEPQTANCSTALTDDNFVYNGVTYRVTDLHWSPGSGTLWWSLDRAGSTLAGLELQLGSTKFDVGASWSFGGISHRWNSVRTNWRKGQRVAVRLAAPPTVAPPTVSASGDPREGGGPVTVTVTLPKPAPDGGVNVTVNLGGTATWGEDYRTPVPAGPEYDDYRRPVRNEGKGWFGGTSSETVQAANLLHIPSGSRSASFEIHVVDDPHEDSGETIDIDVRADHAGIQYTGSAVEDCPTCSRRTSLLTYMGSAELTLTITNHEDAETEAARLAAEAAAEAEKQRLAAARAAAGGPLSGLALSANSQAVALTPAFSPNVLSYRAEVPAGTTGVTLAPSWGAEAELAGSPTVFLTSQGPATMLAQTQVHASGTAAALALSSAGPTRLEVTVLEPDGSGKPLQGTTTKYRVEVVGAAVPQTAAQTVTVAFSNVPPEHDGQAPFTLDVQSGSKPAVEAFTVTNGTVVRAWSLDPVLWRVRVEPKSWKDVKIAFGGASAKVQGPARIRVADARAKEGKDASLDFAVTLNRAASGPVSVDYATKDGTATAGSDYTATSGTLTFAAGETAKTVSVPLLDDAHDEGKETFTLGLSNPRGAYLRKMHREAKGVIRNDDSLQAMWLSRFGRTVAGQTVEALEGRFAAGPGAPSHVTVAGVDLLRAAGEGPDRGPGQARALSETLTGLAQAFGAPSAPAGDDGPFTRRFGDDPAGVSAPARSVTARELLLGSSFHFTTGDASGLEGAMTGWGRVVSGGSSGTLGGGLSFASETATGLLGMDWQRGGLLFGVALSRSAETGSASFAPSGSHYDMEGELSMVAPYLRVQAGDRLSFWSTVGSGSGSMSLSWSGASQSADIAMQLAAAGGRAELLRPEAGGGFALALKGDAFFVRTESARVSTPGVGNLAAATGDASRVRAVLEGSRAFALSRGGSLAPSLSVGLRHDGGDAETGAGVEIGTGLAWSDPVHGLTSDLRLYGLAAHEAGGRDEWGASGSLRMAPDPSGRGLSLSLTPSWGVQGESGRLWGAAPGALSSGTGGGELPGARFDTELGYGLAVSDGVTGTPYAGLGLGGARDYRLGWRLGLDRLPSFSFGVEATRREAANDNAEHGLMLSGALRW